MHFIGPVVQRAADAASMFEGPPKGDRWTMWGGGVVLAMIPVVIGSLVLAGSDRVGLAVFLISLGALWHFHYFWGLHSRLAGFSELGKNLAALPMIGSICYGIYYYLFCT